MYEFLDEKDRLIESLKQSINLLQNNGISNNSGVIGIGGEHNMYINVK